MSVITAIGESYKCFLPKQDEVNKESVTSYKGPNPLELLTPLFSKQACSYRVIIIHLKIKFKSQSFFFF